MSNKKYRPYLTVEQMQRIQSVFASFPDPSLLDVGIEKYIRKYLRDIDEEFIRPNYSVNPVKNRSQENRLGFTEEEILAGLMNESLAALSLDQLKQLSDAATSGKIEVEEAKLDEVMNEIFKREFGM